MFSAELEKLFIQIKLIEQKYQSGKMTYLEYIANKSFVQNQIQMTQRLESLNMSLSETSKQMSLLNHNIILNKYRFT